MGRAKSPPPATQAELPEMEGYGVPRLVEAAQKNPGGRVDVFMKQPNGKVAKVNQAGYDMLESPETWIAQHVGQAGSYMVRVCDARGRVAAQCSVEVHEALAPPSATGWSARGAWGAAAAPVVASTAAGPPPGFISAREAELQIEMAKLKATQEAMARAPSSSSSVVDKMLEMMLVKLMSDEKKDPLDDVQRLIALKEAVGSSVSDNTATELVRVGGDLAKALMLRPKAGDVVTTAAAALPERSGDDMVRLGRILERSILRGWSGADTLDTLLDGFGVDVVRGWAADLQATLAAAMDAHEPFRVAYQADEGRGNKWTESLLDALVAAAQGGGAA